MSRATYIRDILAGTGAPDRESAGGDQ
jgi:hypothetical protein